MEQGGQCSGRACLHLRPTSLTKLVMRWVFSMDMHVVVELNTFVENSTITGLQAQNVGGA